MMRIAPMLMGGMLKQFHGEWNRPPLFVITEPGQAEPGNAGNYR
jgi:hypothetical protein